MIYSQKSSKKRSDEDELKMEISLDDFKSFEEMEETEDAKEELPKRTTELGRYVSEFFSKILTPNDRGSDESEEKLEMGIRPPCCDKLNVKKGLWTAEEDAKLLAYVSTHGTGNWTNVPKKAGLKRCGKSCRLRWTNYLRPNLKHEGFTPQEEELIVTLHATIGSRWSIIANQLPGRTDNDVKNYWNTKLSKKLALNGIDPVTHRPISEIKQSITTLHIAAATAAASTQPLSSAAHDSRLTTLNRNLKKILLSHPIPPPLDSAAPPAHWNEANRIAAGVGALPPAPQELEWIQFLAEDAFSCLEEQDAYRAPSFVAVDADFGGLEAAAAADGPSSFIEEILDRDREIMTEFAGFVGGHYYF